MTLSHTLVLDIGKSNAKLVLIDAAGEVLARRVQANAPMPGPGYTALGVPQLQQWLLDSLADLPERERIARISISTHGAAFCAIDDTGLVLPPIDYEWDGYGDHRAAFAQAIDPFAHTGSPTLPAGLNAGLQLFWLQRTQPAAWARIRHWLPYPQFWAWWLSGVAASEVSSLGCHTQLWAPWAGRFSDWAERSGIAALFPPLRRAGDVLGTLRPALAARWGLSPDCAVLCGVHDSNACLVRYLSLPDTTLLTTGTWTVAMSTATTASPEEAPVPAELFNVSVNGRPVPTARFMGGRDFDHLCAGADPAWATEDALADLRDAGWQARPLPGDQPEAAFEFWCRGQRVSDDVLAVPARLRPALAAVYCAERSAALIGRLSPRGSVVLEGPLAGNVAYGLALAALLGPDRPLCRSIDDLEGTVRGAWQLGCEAPALADTRSSARVQLIRSPPSAAAARLTP
ncbi:FGGY family carbohydrate kinase [Sphaerotilus sp.]|uniref:FGGY family carbohydrate kinase n=1 Tax=Sphaerotilus sp. TaxID=2093942 RepID=UPI00286E5721|nr:FGGY family carbohydrate kinase [Sphaerotilus sp.]